MHTEIRSVFDTSHIQGVTRSQAREVLALLPVASLILEGEQVAYANDAARELLGSQSTTPGTFYLETLHPEDQRQERDLLHAVLQGTKRSYQLERRQQIPGPRTLWLQSLVSAVYGPDGSVQFTIVTLSDFTLLRGYAQAFEAEDALRASEDKFRLVVEHIPEVFWIASARGRRMLYLSPAYSKIWGQNPLDVQRRPMDWVRSIFGEDRPAILEVFRRGVVTAPAETVFPDFRILRSDGGVRWIRARGSILPATTESPARMVGIAEDITEKKSFEEQRHQSEKMRAIGHLAGGVAHDFNNQLAGIMGYADALNDGVRDNPTLARYAESLIQCVNRASGLTGQLLAFARKGKFLARAVDIHGVIFEVVSLLKHSFDKRIQIRQRLDANPSTTLGDPNQIQNAILNLALNARDAMPAGGDISFETDVLYLEQDPDGKTRGEIEPGNYIRIRVKDSGSGMSPETVRHIFEPFYTTKSQGRGTGMGLAALYGTVQNHRGAVSVHSEVGHGSTFEIYLKSHSEPAPIAEPPGEVRPRLPGHVLLIDDEKSVLATGEIMLESLGYKVTLASNGAQAIKIFQAEWQSIDLVILDMTMPVMSGAETFATLRKIDPAARVLLASGYSINGEVQAVLNSGALAFLQKPYRKRDLVTRLASLPD